MQSTTARAIISLPAGYLIGLLDVTIVMIVSKLVTIPKEDKESIE